MISWHEDKNEEESDSKVQNWTPELLEIRKKVEAITGIEFNAVLLNLYRNGNDGVAWHSDHTEKSGIDPVIASVSFGETRMFKMRHKFKRK